jgi:hypothetical protein
VIGESTFLTPTRPPRLIHRLSPDLGERGC